METLRPELDAIRVPYGAISKGGKKGQILADMEAMSPHVAAFSDDGRGVQDAALMRQANTSFCIVDDEKWEYSVL